MATLSRRAFAAAVTSGAGLGFASRYRTTERSIGPPAGEIVVLHDDKSGIEASICPSQGGELSSLRLRHKGQWYELLYRALDYSPAEGWRGKAPLLWPATGTSSSPRGAGYVFKDRFYPMPAHGFIREMPWEVVRRGSDGSAAFVSLQVGDTAATREQYPFGFRLAVDYRVTNGTLLIGYTVTAARDNSDSMFFSVGNHITFRTPFLTGTQPADMRLFTPASLELVKSPRNLPTGETRPWKLSGPTPLSGLKRLEAISLSGYSGQGYSGEDPYVTMQDPAGLGIRLSHSATVVPPQPVVLFNLWGDGPGGYFSPEPWVGLQNSFNLKKGLTYLEPGSEFGWRLRLERLPG